MNVEEAYFYFQKRNHERWLIMPYNHEVFLLVSEFGFPVKNINLYGSKTLSFFEI